MANFSYQTFSMPKAGNSVEEYEDACWPIGSQPGFPARRARFAIADGASEASFSGEWARLLVQEYPACSHVSNFRESLPALRARWLRGVCSRPLPWYAEEKVRSGAFSSILGFTLWTNANGSDKPPLPTGIDTGSCAGGRWHAYAIGDSCLFHVRGERLVAAFPLHCSSQFNNRPWLLSSRPGPLCGEAEIQRAGRWETGDSFYLMTDALACWFLRRQEEDGSGIACLSDVRDQRIFESLVHDARSERTGDGHPALRNDDVTLLRVETGG